MVVLSWVLPEVRARRRRARWKPGLWPQVDQGQGVWSIGGFVAKGGISRKRRAFPGNGGVSLPAPPKPSPWTR